MFPAKDLPNMIRDDASTSARPDNTNEVNESERSPMKISGHQCGTTFCIILILFIIASSIMIGILSVFIPKTSNVSSVSSTAETVTLTLVLPITQNSSNVLSLNNNSLTANNYLTSAQRNVLIACLQTQLNSDNRTKQMTILSIGTARAQYSGNSNNQTDNLQQRERRQISAANADQVQMIVSIQCSLLISQTDCQESIESVLDNGKSLQCTPVDQISTTLSTILSSTIGITIEKTNSATTQHWRQVGELFLAFGLTSAIGLERQLRGKSAGLRTHSIVGITSALILQVSKYGFSDVIQQGIVVLDPSRIAAQIISGISFLGAGLIITRQAAVRGLTTAASIWSAAAIGMAAGAGLWLLSLAVTGFHFVILLGFLPLEKRLPVFDHRSSFRKRDDDDDDDAQSV